MADQTNVILARSSEQDSRQRPKAERHASIIHPTESPGALRSDLGLKSHRLILRLLKFFGMGHLLFSEPISAYKNRDAFHNFNLLHPAETILLGDPAKDDFLRCCQDLKGGRLERASIFTCEIPAAKFSAEHGLVCDRNWRGIIESALDARRYNSFKKTFRPRAWERRSGVFSSVQHAWHFNNWHWTADCLPQLRSLAVHMQGRPLTLLMSAGLYPSHRESLECLLPDNFTVEYVDLTKWFELETFVLPSYVSSRANAYFPSDYYDFIRDNTYSKLGIVKPEAATGRFYISRGRAKHRRVSNEPALEAMVHEFGFEKIFIEDYTFREQVELFRNAEAIISPHGAALGGMIYGEDLKVCVLYSEARPAGYFYTLARGLGHQHFCTRANKSEDDDFPADLVALRRIITEQMRLS